MTIKNREMRLAYESAPAELKEATDCAFAAVERSIQDSVFSGRLLNCAKDDRAENLVTEIFAFICESNGIAWRGFAFEKPQTESNK
jgi:hypothetical protein